MVKDRMATEERPNASLLTSPLFVLALSLLLANDFVLKPLFANPLTGKLSDFAGLFVFAVFWTALLPRRPALVHLVTAIAFSFWKLPLSDGLIAAWNSFSLLHLGRVADPSDLIALLVLPLSYMYSASRDEVPVRRWKTVAIAVLSLFAFAATSYQTDVPFDKKFIFAGSPDALSAQLKKAGIHVYVNAPCAPSTSGSWELSIPADLCFDTVDAQTEIAEKGATTELRLLSMEHRCPRSGHDKEDLLRIFTLKVIRPLALRRVR